jgi:hypothetical protein
MSGTLNCAIKNGFRVSFDDRVKTSASSKGNQIKWHRSDGIWAKSDDMGCEGLAEQTASCILACSNFTEYVCYASCKIYEDNDIHTGCECADFLSADERLITLARLFQADVLRYEKDMEKMQASQRLAYLIEHTGRITGMKGFGKWLGMLLELDAFILNEDRHLHNIAVVKKADGTYKPMPVFDNGASFLSDASRDYPLNSSMNLARLISRAKSKPIATSFDKQVAAVEDVVGLSLKFNSTPETMQSEVASQEYSGQIVARVRNIISHQAKRYPHLFSSAPKSVSLSQDGRVWPA